MEKKSVAGVSTLGFKHATTSRASEEIMKQIQTAILGGQLKPGDRLPSERELINIFGRSRPTVREALRMLERAGLITIIPGSGGAIVKELSTSHVEQPLEMMLQLNKLTPFELFEFREATETTIVRWAAMRRTDEDLMRMKKVLQLEEEYMDNWERFHQTDVDFHETVANAARNRVASILMKVIRQMLVETITAGFKRLSLEQRKYEQARLLEHHWQIASAIERQDPEEAVKILHEHLLQFKNLFPINGKNDEEQ